MKHLKKPTKQDEIRILLVEIRDRIISKSQTDQQWWCSFCKTWVELKHNHYKCTPKSL